MLAHPPAAVGAIAATCATVGRGATDSAAATAIRRAAFREKPVRVRIRSESVPTSMFLASD